MLNTANKNNTNLKFNNTIIDGIGYLTTRIYMIITEQRNP